MKFVKTFEAYNERLNEMNYYEQRIAKLDKDKLPKEVFSDGRNRRISNDEYWNMLNIGDVIYPTVWFLRNIRDINSVSNAAKNGLTIIEKGEIYIRELTFKLGEWQGGNVNALWFEEIDTPLSFSRDISQQIWKINDEVL